MKKSLTILGSIAVLLVASTNMNNTANNTNVTTLTTKPIKPMINETATALFNNKYGYLSTGETANWITSQSQKDGNFYSYDTSHLTNADGSIWYLSDGKTDARAAFQVDSSDGNLIYNPEIKISDQDKINLENSKGEMIKDQEITTIKDKYNPYSKSEYADKSYFTGGNPNWQYLQFGGVEKHIDISQQPVGNKVEHNDNLSETLGLYYIAKAVIQQKIDTAIANNLANYFISQSSLKNEKINETLINQIIKLIIENSDIYNFIYKTPMRDGQTNLYKNYSLNYIFDSNNNLVAISYNKWDNTSSINCNINAGDSIVAPDDGDYGYDWWWSGINTIVDWKKYANTWNYFIEMYPTFSFGTNSYLLVHNNQTGDNKETNLSDNTAAISNTQPPDLSNLENAYQNDWNSNAYYKFRIEKDYDDGYPWSQVCFALYLWHDDNNIYYQTSAVIACHEVFNEGNSFQYHLDNCIFTNIMN